MLPTNRVVSHMGLDPELGINAPLMRPQDEPRPRNAFLEQLERENLQDFLNSGLSREEYDAETRRGWENIRRMELWGNRLVRGIQIASLTVPPLVIIGAGAIVREKYPDEIGTGNGFILGGVLLGACFAIFSIRHFCCKARQ